jgi:hypothetical protein
VVISWEPKQKFIRGLTSGRNSLQGSKCIFALLKLQTASGLAWCLPECHCLFLGGQGQQLVIAAATDAPIFHDIFTWCACQFIFLFATTSFDIFMTSFPKGKCSLGDLCCVPQHELWKHYPGCNG